jgi:hypothetical protein
MASANSGAWPTSTSPSLLSMEPVGLATYGPTRPRASDRAARKARVSLTWSQARRGPCIRRPGRLGQQGGAGRGRTGPGAAYSEGARGTHSLDSKGTLLRIMGPATALGPATGTRRPAFKLLGRRGSDRCAAHCWTGQPAGQRHPPAPTGVRSEMPGQVTLHGRSRGTTKCVLE